jgi:hypothetical protein
MGGHNEPTNGCPFHRVHRHGPPLAHKLRHRFRHTFKPGHDPTGLGFRHLGPGLRNHRDRLRGLQTRLFRIGIGPTASADRLDSGVVVSGLLVASVVVSEVVVSEVVVSEVVVSEVGVSGEEVSEVGGSVMLSLKSGRSDTTSSRSRGAYLHFSGFRFLNGWVGARRYPMVAHKPTRFGASYGLFAGVESWRRRGAWAAEIDRRAQRQTKELRPSFQPEPAGGPHRRRRPVGAYRSVRGPPLPR